MAQGIEAGVISGSGGESHSKKVLNNQQFCLVQAYRIYFLGSGFGARRLT